MKQSPKGRSRKPRKGKKVKRNNKAQSVRGIEAVRAVSTTLEEGFIAAFQRIVRRIK